MTETFIHIAMRKYLKKEGWTLVAGEYPGGSDDELFVLSIMNPIVAKDNSPDPRRHSEGEIIPDLFAYKNGFMLVIEAKPQYDIGDREKLKDLFLNKRGLLQKSLKNFCKNHHLLKQINLDNLIYIPVLAFGNENYEIFPEETGFAHIYVKNLKECKIIYFGESGESEI